MVRMNSDGATLPGPAETVVLLRLGLIRSDGLPGLAARWLAADVVDTPSVRMLAGEVPGDRWLVEDLLGASVVEADVVVPTEATVIESIAADRVAAIWRETGRTRWAVATLAELGNAHPELEGLGTFVGLDDEWGAGWGRTPSELEAEARYELERLSRGCETS